MMVALTVLITIGLGQKTDKFLAILGSVSCTPVAFIFPASFHLKACAVTTTQKAIDLSLIIVWTGLGLYCTVLNLRDWNN